MDGKPNWAAQTFLILHPAAVGCLLGALVLDPGAENRGFMVTCATVAVVFALAGEAAPVLSIKKPLRSYRFLAGVGHSPLSRQAVLVGMFTLLLLAYWILALANVEALWLGIVTLVVGASAVFAAGLVYLLGSHPGWSHWSTLLAPFGGLLSLGVSTSLVIALGWRDILLGGADGALVSRILVLVGAVTLETAVGVRAAHLRKQDISAAAPAIAASGQGWGPLPGSVLFVVAGAGAAASFAWDWAIIVCFVALVSGLVIHWRSFFATNAPLSWEAEVNWYTPTPAAGKE
jgi:DMSO reductase anchor subunit